MTDPLAGRREAINERRIDVLVWPDDGTGCPVEVGQVFRLRTCNIEITRVSRLMKPARWKADFRRHFREGRPRFMKYGHGSSLEEREGMVSGEEWGATTLQTVINPEDRGRKDNLRVDAGPREPELVPADEIPDLAESRKAQLRFEQEMTRRRLDLDCEPLSRRVARLLALHESGEVNLNREFKAIAGKVAEGERKAKLRRAA